MDWTAKFNFTLLIKRACHVARGYVCTGVLFCCTDRQTYIQHSTDVRPRYVGSLGVGWDGSCGSSLWVSRISPHSSHDPAPVGSMRTKMCWLHNATKQRPPPFWAYCCCISPLTGLVCFYILVYVRKYIIIRSTCIIYSVNGTI